MNLNEADSDESSSGAGAGAIAPLLLLPITVVGIYAFVEKALVAEAIVNLLGAGGVAVAVTNAMWVIGAVTVAMLAVFALVTIAAIIAAIVKREPVRGAIGLLGAIYFGFGYYLATTMFSEIPVLVGFVLATNLMVYGVSVVVVAVMLVVAMFVIDFN